MKISAAGALNLAMVVAAWTADAEQVQLAEAGKGTLVVLPVDVFGRTISSAKIAVYSSSGGEHSPVEWQPEKELPFGTYVVEISASGFVRLSEEIALNWRRLDVFGCLRVGSGDAGSRIMPAARIAWPGGDRGCRQVLIQPMFCPSNRMPVVSLLYQGSFVAEGLEAGRYVAVSVSPGRFCGSVAFDITFDGAKIVELSAAGEELRRGDETKAGWREENASGITLGRQVLRKQ